MAFNLLWVAIPLIFLVPILPLYILVRVFGGEASILRVIGVKVAGLILSVVLGMLLGGIAGIASFIIMLFVYKAVFQIGFGKALLIWVLDLVLMAVLLIVALILLGAGLSSLGAVIK
ncbi:TPA: hypothetical protein HA265_06515 [Candidatus Woesearchaeota archaeon]|nr:hypothetical protein [Candidatus Woesearchaeota archaeon]